MEQVTAIIIGNRLDPLGTREVRRLAPGRTVDEYARELFPLSGPETLIAAAVDGAVAPGDRVLAAGESLVIAAVPRGGGSSGKNPLATVAMIAVMVAATYASGGAFAVGGWFAAGSTSANLLSAGIMLAGGVLVSALFPAALPDVAAPNGGDIGGTPTYSWDPDPNASAEGVAWPVVYGTHRVCPVRLSYHIETQGDDQYLNLLFGVADHALTSITDVEIDGNPVSQYPDVVVETRLGALDQAPVQFFGDTKADVAVGAKLSTSWTTRTTEGNAVEGFGVGIVMPRGLYYASDSGGLDEVTAKIEIEYRLAGGDWKRIKIANTEPVAVTSGYWSGGYGWGDNWTELEAGSTNPIDHANWGRYEPADNNFIMSEWIWRWYYCWRWVENETIYQPGDLEYDYIEVSGATQSAIRRMIYRDNLAEAGEHEIRVRLKEALEEGPRWGTDVYWDYYQEILYDDFRYPGASLLAVRALATDRLSGSMPRVTCLAARDTVPVWIGAAYEDKAADNPAWACWDMLHDDVYGGGFAHTRMHLSAFESWAAWCSDRGYEVNVYLDSSMSLRQSLNLVGVLGRGSVVQVGSKFTALVDRPEALPVQRFLFTQGNIGAASFKEEWLSHEDRANVIEVTYWDKELNYERQTLPVFADGYDSSAAPIITAQVSLIGCVYRDQAVKHGRALVRRNRYLTLTGQWEAGPDAVGCLPGDVVEVAHDRPQWGYSGRIVEAAADSVTLDRAVIREPGKSYALTLRQADDTREDVSVVGVATETESALLPIVGAWAYGTPVRFDTYSFGEIDRLFKLFRVLSITRAPGMKYRFTGLEYVAEVYSDAGTVPDPEVFSDLPAVAGLRAVERWVPGPDGAGRSVIALSWRGYALLWHVFLRQAGGAWVKVGEARRPEFLVEGVLSVGLTYEVAVSREASPEGGLTASVTILGKLAPPSDVTGFQAWQDGGLIRFKWNHIADVDLWGYEIRRGPSWAAGLVVKDGVQEAAAAWTPPLSGTYTFWIKAIDESDIYSATAASATLTVSIDDEINIVADHDEISAGVSSATLANLVYLSGAGVVAWIPGLTDTDFGSETDTDIPDYAGDGAEGVYTSQPYDLGESTDFTLRMDAEYAAAARGATDLSYPDRTDQTYPSDTDTSITSESTYRPEFRTSVNGITWEAWALWTETVQCSGRHLQVRVTTEVDGESTYFYFSQITSTADVRDKRATAFNQSIDAAGTTFTLASLGLVIFDHYEVGVTVLGTAAKTPAVDKTSTQFTIRLFDITGTGVSGNVDITVRGF